MKEGWEEKRIGDLAEIKGGKRLPKGVKLLATPTRHPYIRVADFNDFGTVDTNDIHYISDVVYEQIKRYIIKKEDVYISIAGTIGKSGVIPDYLDGANLTENACRLVLSNNLNQRYVYYFTISPSFIKQIDERTKKSAQPKLALTRLADVIISYPNIKEQQSIVDYLDAAFAKIDAMKANAEKALNEAKALFQASLKEMLEPKEGWEEKKLGEICKDLFSGGDAPKGNMAKEPTEEYNIPIYANAAELDGLYGYTNYYRVNEPSVTIAARGSGTGLVIKRKGAYLPIVRLIVAIPQSFLSVDYLYFALQIISIKSNGSAIPQLTVPAIKQYRICYPPKISEQQSIVTTLDTLKSKVDRLQANYDKISQECDALKQAILRQVFE